MLLMSGHGGGGGGGGSGIGAIAAGQGYLELFLKSDKLNAGLANAAQNLKTWSMGVGAMGTKLTGYADMILAPIMKIADESAHKGEHFQHMSERTGVAVSALSELGYAAQQGGIDIDTLDLALNKMNKTLGSSLGAKTLKLLGINLADIKNMSPDQQLEIIAEAIHGMDTQAKKTAAVMAVFGRGGAALLPMFHEGAEGIREMRQEARDLGIVMGPEKAAAAKEYVQAWNRFERVSKGIKTAIASAVIPALTQWAQVCLQAVLPVRDFVRANKEWVSVLFTVASVVSVAGMALVFFGAAGLLLSGVIAGLAAASTILGFVWGVISSPIFLIVAGVGLLAAGFIYLTGTASTIISALKGIGQALMSGQWALAGAIAMKALEVVWLKSINAMSNMWVGLKYSVLGIMDSLGVGLQKLWGDIIERIKIEWLGLQKIINPMMDIESAIAKVQAERKTQDQGIIKRRQKKRDEAMKGELDAYGEQIKKSQEELDGLIGQAGKKNGKSFDEQYPFPKKKDVKALIDAANIGTAGTFSGMAASRFLGLGSAPSVNEKIKDAFGETNDLLQELINEVMQGGAAFN